MCVCVWFHDGISVVNWKLMFKPSTAMLCQLFISDIHLNKSHLTPFSWMVDLLKYFHNLQIIAVSWVWCLFFSLTTIMAISRIHKRQDGSKSNKTCLMQYMHAVWKSSGQFIIICFFIFKDGHCLHETIIREKTEILTSKLFCCYCFGFFPKMICMPCKHIWVTMCSINADKARKQIKLKANTGKMYTEWNAPLLYTSHESRFSLSWRVETVPMISSSL